MLFRVLDIETVPDLAVWTPGPVTWRARPGQGVSGLGERRVFSSSEMVYERENPFPPPQANRVVAVAWCDVLLKFEEPKTFAFATAQTHCAWGDDQSEVDLLCLLRAEMRLKPATLLTWNGRGFDLPVLAMRAMHRGISWGWYYDEHNIRYRYSEDGHCDLMDYLSDFGSSRSMKLDDVCRLVGLPGKAASGADDMDGSKVAEVVAASPTSKQAMDKVGRYCLQDVLQTALVFVRTRHHLEILDDVGYQASVATFRDSEQVRGAIEVDWERVLSLPGSKTP